MKPINLNTDNIRRWVEALESGEFEQGRGVLYDTETNRFCCLGVACELAHRDGIVTAHDCVSERDHHPYVRYYGEDECYAVLPLEVMNWLGFSHPSPSVELGGGAVVELTTLNDAHGYTFTQIAELIRSGCL